MRLPAITPSRASPAARASAMFRRWRRRRCKIPTRPVSLSRCTQRSPHERERTFVSELAGSTNVVRISRAYSPRAWYFRRHLIHW